MMLIIKMELTLLSVFALWTATLTTNAKEAKETITCDAPSVRDGQPATVTCDFKRDVSALSSATVTVEHYPDGSPDPIPVLECTPVGDECKLPVLGYEFNNQINTKLVLNITSASMENSGRFACKMMSPDLAETDEVEPCYFTVVVGSTSTTISTTPPPNTSHGPLPGGIDIIALIVGLIVAVIVIAAVAIIIVCIIKKRRDGRKDQTEEDQSALTSPQTHTESSPQTQASDERQDDEREPLDRPSDRLLDDKKTTSQQETESSPQTQASDERKDDEREPLDRPSDRLLDNKKTTSQQETFGISPAEAGTMTSADERDQEHSPAPAGLGEQDSRANDDDGEPGKQPVEVSDEQSQTARGGEGSNEKITPVEDNEGGVDTSQLPPFKERQAKFE